eukprot:gene13994-16540_t
MSATVVLLLPPAAHALVTGQGLVGACKAPGRALKNFNENVYFLDKVLRIPYYLVNSLPALAVQPIWAVNYVAAITHVVAPLRKWFVGLKGVEAVGSCVQLSKGVGHVVQAVAYGSSCLVSLFVYWWCNYSLPLSFPVATIFKQVVAWTWLVGLAVASSAAFDILRTAVENTQRYSREEREKHPLFFKRNRRNIIRSCLLLLSSLADCGVAFWMVGLGGVTKVAMGVCGAAAAVFAIGAKLCANKNDHEKRLHGDINIEPAVFEQVVAASEVVASAETLVTLGQSDSGI